MDYYKEHRDEYEILKKYLNKFFKNNFGMHFSESQHGSYSLYNLYNIEILELDLNEDHIRLFITELNLKENIFKLNQISQVLVRCIKDSLPEDNHEPDTDGDGFVSVLIYNNIEISNIIQQLKKLDIDLHINTIQFNV